MNIEAALAKHVTEAPQTAAHIGGRMYPKRLPQNPTYPAIVYHRVSGNREHSHDSSSGLAHPRIQLDVYARTHVEAKAVAEAVRSVLDGLPAGKLGGSAGVDTSGVFLEDDDDGYDDDFEIYWFRMDFSIFHNE